MRISDWSSDVCSSDLEMLFRIMGFGQAPNPQAEAGRVHHLRESFGPSLRVVADAVGLAFDGIEASGQTALARKQIKIAAGVVEAGTVAAMRTTVSGKIGRASCGERVCQYGSISVVAVSLKKTTSPFLQRRSDSYNV